MSDLRIINPAHPVMPVQRPDHEPSQRDKQKKLPKTPVNHTEPNGDDDSDHPHIDEYA